MIKMTKMTKMTKTSEISLEFANKFPQATNFLQKLECKGIRFELSKKISKLGDELDDFLLGINTYDSIWSWFELFELNNKEWAHFAGSYSMNTGKTKKGMNRQIKVVTELHRQLGISGGNGYDLL
jgi:hypothetical protein